ncbi:MAG: hypothetical protein Q8922_16100 [Bacteroidota bacterium]|nr:hypothetical protein [Bacteroidota bacterium]
MFLLPPEPKREVVCTYQGIVGKDFQIFSNSITIAMNRDLVKNIELASAIALRMAFKFPAHNVLLVNTYAGTDLMQRSLADAIYRECMTANKKLPSAYQQYLPNVPAHDCDDTATFDFPENLRVLNSPTGRLTATSLAEEVEECHATTVILNSFEFTTWTLFMRAQFAQGLVGLQQRLHLTLIVFSHEMRHDMGPFRPGRGPIGILTAYAKSVWLLVDDGEDYYANQQRKRALHEKQTQIQSSQAGQEIEYEATFSNAAGLKNEEEERNLGMRPRREPG